MTSAVAQETRPDVASTDRIARDARGRGSTDGLTLVLHGALSSSTVPHLEAVLDGLALLQPGYLIVDLSDVERVSRAVWRLIARSGAEIGGLVLRSPSLAGSSDLPSLELPAPAAAAPVALRSA